MSVTGNSEKKSAVAKRQERRRAELKAQGFKEVDLILGPAEQVMLDEGRRVRGGVNGPYDVTEYLAALIREDNQRLHGLLGEARQYPCRQCGKPLPQGCGGTFKGELACLHTPTAWKFEIPAQVEA